MLGGRDGPGQGVGGELGIAGLLLHPAQCGEVVGRLAEEPELVRRLGGPGEMRAASSNRRSACAIAPSIAVPCTVPQESPMGSSSVNATLRRWRWRRAVSPSMMHAYPASSSPAASSQGRPSDRSTATPCSASASASCGRPCCRRRKARCRWTSAVSSAEPRLFATYAMPGRDRRRPDPGRRPMPPASRPATAPSVRS